MKSSSPVFFSGNDSFACSFTDESIRGFKMDGKQMFLLLRVLITKLNVF